MNESNKVKDSDCNQNKRDFINFQKMTSNVNPRVPIWLEKTINRFERFKGIAYDLGCGAGNQAIYLLENGWKVIAVDKEVDVFNKKRQELKKELQDNLEIVKMSFENLKLEEKSDLIIAINSLPFCSPDKFEEMWKNIDNSLKIGGRIAVTLFGVNDDFNKENSGMTFFNKDEIYKLLENFEIEGKTGDIIEKEFDGKMVNGNNHHWHKYIIVAKKIK